MNIASPPASQNVLNITSFDALEQLKGKIFSAICTGDVISIFIDFYGYNIVI